MVNNYANFGGTATRRQFWTFWFAKLIFGLVGILIPGINALVVLVEIGLIISTLAVGARRLHERNLSGWWQLLNFVPILGWIALVIMLALPATVTSSGEE